MLALSWVQSLNHLIMKHSYFDLSLYFENYQYGLSQSAVKLPTLETKKTKRSQCQHKNGNLKKYFYFSYFNQWKFTYLLH